MLPPGYGFGDIAKAIELAHALQERFRDAPKEFQVMRHHIENLRNVLQELDGTGAIRQQDFQQHQLGPIVHECETLLEETQATLYEYDCLLIKANGFRSKCAQLWKRLRFEPKKVTRLESRASANFGALNALLGLSSRETTLKDTILAWIAEVDLAGDHDGKLRRKTPGTLEWVAETAEFKKWISEKNQTIYCPGDAGAGKTTFTAKVVYDLFTVHRDELGNVGICFLYCSFNDKSHHTLESLLATLLKQLLLHRPLPESIKSRYHTYHQRHQRLSVDEIMKELRVAIKARSKAYVVVDGLDECDEGCRYKFLKMLKSLRDQRDDNGTSSGQTDVKILVTSRPFPKIAASLGEGILTMPICARRNDIFKYLDLAREEFDQHYLLDDSWTSVKDEIVRIADGKFLMATLSFNCLGSKTSVKATKEALKILPRGAGAYDAMYDEIMTRITDRESHRRELALQALSWIVYAKRSLTTTELQHALAIERNSSALDPENISREDIVSLCAGLVTLDEKSSTVKIMHKTAKEYFERNPNRLSPNVESTIAQSCITYLSYEAFKTGFCPTEEEFAIRLLANPFYTYAASFWGQHAILASLASKDTLEFLKDAKKVEASAQALHVYKDSLKYYSQETPKDTHGLHLAAFFGLEEEVDMLLCTNIASELRDSYSRTPLSWAAVSGNCKIIEMFLKEGCHVDTKDKFDQTPILLAAQKGNLEAVVVFLGHGADPDVHDVYGRSSLSWAAERGHNLIVKTLLKSEKVEKNSQNNYYRPPLAWAALAGRENVVTSLIDAGANLNVKDKDGRTPLFLAVVHDRFAVAILLLQAGANPNVADKKALTPLLFAAFNERPKAVKILLENGSSELDLNFKETDEGRTALSYAAEFGDKETLKLLLSHPTTDPILSDRDKWTPLHWAADEGHEIIVKILLNNSKVNEMLLEETKQPLDKWKQTPFMRAARNGHECILKLLLTRSDAQLNMKDCTGWTPLILAVRESHESIVEFLLGNPTTDPNLADTNDRTPLSWASHLGRDSIVQKLLANTRVLVDSKDTNGATPLSWAARKGHTEVVRLLLNANADINSEDNKSNTPIFLAARNGHVNVVALLLERHANVEHEEMLAWFASHIPASQEEYKIEELFRQRIPSIVGHIYGLDSLFFPVPSAMSVALSTQIVVPTIIGASSLGQQASTQMISP